MYNDYSDYTSYTTGYNNTGGGLLAGLGLGVWLFSMAISILMIVSLWKIFKKAGKPGWASIVPIYNIIVLLEIVELPMWYIALFFLPFANIYAMFKIFIELAHKFGKSTGFGVLMIFFSEICLPILAFGKYEYKGNNLNVENTPVPTEPLPQTFTSMQNNLDDNSNNINSVNNINNQTINDNPMTETGFVPVGNLNNNIQSPDNQVNLQQNENKETINIPVSQIPNVTPVDQTNQVNTPVQMTDIQADSNTANALPNIEPSISNIPVQKENNNLAENNTSISNVEPVVTNNSVNNDNNTVFTNMNNNV